jgi:Tol biopolymer transport system component
MRRPTASCLLLLASCGARIAGNASDQEVRDAASDADAPGSAIDASSFGPWAMPAMVTPAATPATEEDSTLSASALELVFTVNVRNNGKDLYYTSRTAIGQPWTAAQPLFHTAASEEAPRFSADGLALFFATDPVTGGNLDVYFSTRAEVGSTVWSAPRPLTGFDTAAAEKWFAPCSDQQHYVVVEGANGSAATDLYEGTIGGGAPQPITQLNTAATETGAFLTADCLTLYFASTRVTPGRIFVSHRATVASPWQLPDEIDDFKLGGTDTQEDPSLSADGRVFAFASNAAGNKDVYLTTR